MRILYGIQGTGNGHITRARTMERALAESSIEVDYLFFDRPQDKFFNMEAFAGFRSHRGLTFCWKNGPIDYLRMVLSNNLVRFIHDFRTLDLSGYDLVITDFEPITAWAAKLQNKPSLGIDHQYAFNSGQVPASDHTLLGSMVLKHFAPTLRRIGFHWHHFNGAILPPMIEPLSYPLTSVEDKILVYLPFKNSKRVIDFLRAFKEVNFYIYCDTDAAHDDQNIHLRPFHQDAFQQDLASCNGVIANAGFGLLSETIQAGKKLLVRPTRGQMKQLSNAEAIEKLEIGEVMYDFNLKQLREWLSEDSPGPRPYPNVARAIVEWIESDFAVDEMALAEQL